MHRPRWMTAGVIALGAFALLTGCKSTKKADDGAAMAAPTAEEQAAMEAAWAEAMTPGEAHAEMAKWAGDWSVTSTFWMQPGADPMVTKAKASFRPIMGGRYMVQEYSGDFMGMPFDGFGLSGYDNASGEYVSTWCDSMSTGIMMMTGTRTEDGAFHYMGSYNDPMGGKTTMRSVVIPRDDDQFLFVMYSVMPGVEGEVKVGELLYDRVK